MFLAGIFVFWGGRGDPAPGATPTEQAPSPKNAAASKALLKAADAERRRPDDWDAQVRSWEEATWACEGTPMLPDARRGLDLCLERRAKAFGLEMDRIEKSTASVLAVEDFGRALETLSTDRTRFGAPQWTQLLEKRIGDVRGRAEALLAEREREACERKRQGDEAGAASAREKVAKWNMPELLVRFDKSLAAAEVLHPRPAGSGPKRTPEAGGPGGVPYEDLPDPPAFLVGLKITAFPPEAPKFIQSVRPVYLSETGLVEGKILAHQGHEPTSFVARAGYALGRLYVRNGSDKMLAMKLVFMKRVGSRLDPSDRYETAWFGSGQSGAEVELGQGALPVVGLFGKGGADAESLGLILLE